MRLAPLAFLVAFLALAPSLASARPWRGVTPGQTTQSEVIERFGDPTKRTKVASRLVLAYYGEQALEGTKQAQFHVDASGVVVEVTVFVTEPLDADSVEGTYGKPPQKTFVEDTFQKAWVYPQQGVTVYFSKENQVVAISYTAGKPAPARSGDAADRPAPGAGR
jgi:hypothetical protein